MNKLLRVLIILPAILFVVVGLRYLVDPAGAAAQFGMPLLEGVGLSSQIGDLSAFFLCLGIFMLLGVITQTQAWFYAPAMLLGLTAVGRVLAWLVHDAAFAIDMILAEVVIASLLLFAAARLKSTG